MRLCNYTSLKDYITIYKLKIGTTKETQWRDTYRMGGL